MSESIAVPVVKYAASRLDDTSCLILPRGLVILSHRHHLEVSTVDDEEKRYAEIARRGIKRREHAQTTTLRRRGKESEAKVRRYLQSRVLESPTLAQYRRPPMLRFDHSRVNDEQHKWI
jgi:hypothetical protein